MPFSSLLVRAFRLACCVQCFAMGAYGTIDESYGLELGRINKIAVADSATSSNWPAASIINLTQLSLLSGCEDIRSVDSILPTPLYNISTNDTGQDNRASISMMFPGATQHLRTSGLNRASHLNTSQSAPIEPLDNRVLLPESPQCLYKFRARLASDAIDIVNSFREEGARKYTTAVCVALKERDGDIKKFIFHSGSDLVMPMQWVIYHKKYKLIQSERSHAEGQLIQFLLHNPGVYEHIVGIGCSRKYCPECDYLFSLFLGIDYYKICAAVLNTFDAPVFNDEVSGDFVLDSNGGSVYQQRVKVHSNYQIRVGERNAIIMRNSCKNNYLPPSLREKLCWLVQYRLKFEGGRF